VTAVGAAVPTCPECHKADAIDLSNGDWLCLQCHHEWNPADVPPELPSVDSILGPGDPELPGITPVPEVPRVAGWAEREPELTSAGREAASGTGEQAPDWSGLFVRDTLHPERGVLLVVDDDGGPGLELQGSDPAASYIAGRETCEILALPDEGIAMPGAPVSDAGEPLAPVILAIAGLTLEAGADSVGDDAERTLYNPRIGWLPPPCDGVPEAEQGVAYAVAILIRHFDIPNELVRQLAAGLLTGAQAGTELEQG
jgi:hypothetical protein